MAPTVQLLIMVAGLAGMAVLGFSAFSGPSTSKATQRRLESVRERHSRSTEVAAQAQMRRILQTRNDSKMEGVLQQLIPNPALLRKRLQQTGRNWTLVHYFGGCFGLVFGTAILLRLWGLPFLLALFAGLAIGIGLPHYIVGKMIKRRIARFTAKFPDAIDLMVRGLRSGLPITETMGVISDEVPGPISEEFRSVSDKMKIGRTMDVALQEAADRLGTPEFQFFVITLAIQRETGGNLAETLNNLSEVLRKRAAMKLKIKAMSSESKASAWIVGSLPFIVFGLIWFINESYMGKFFTDDRLIIAGCGGIVWMAIGAYIMAKMVDFEI